MERTRRFWSETTVFLFLTAFSGVTQQPILLIGAGGIAMAILGRQFAFALTVARLDGIITIDHSVEQAKVQVGDPVTVTVEVQLPLPSPSNLAFKIVPPVPAQTEPSQDLMFEIEPGQQEACLEVPIEFNVSGTYSFEPTIISVTDPHGLFKETIFRNPSFSVTVDTRGPDDAYIGRGGVREGTAFTGASIDRIPAGLEPQEVREYVPGDTLRRIDWNATARFNSPHVREFEAGTDRSILLILDHRSPLLKGLEGRTAFDYLRTVAVGVLSNAQTRREKISLVTIDDSGATILQTNRAVGGTYEAIRRQVLSLNPNPLADDNPLEAKGTPWTPQRAKSMTSNLKEDESTFARVLRTFFATSATFANHETHQPLFTAVRSAYDRLQRPKRVMLFTGDNSKSEIQQIVDYICQRDSELYLFLAPTVLFDKSDLTDVETARRRYIAFESFRRDLTERMDGEAFEVSPGDTIDSIRNAGKPSNVSNR